MILVHNNPYVNSYKNIYLDKYFEGKTLAWLELACILGKSLLSLIIEYSH